MLSPTKNDCEIFVCSMQCIALDRITNHLTPVSGLQCPASVEEIVTSFMDRSSPDLEHSFSAPCTNVDFFSRLIESGIMTLIDGPLPNLRIFDTKLVITP